METEGHVPMLNSVLFPIILNNEIKCRHPNFLIPLTDLENKIPILCWKFNHIVFNITLQNVFEFNYSYWTFFTLFVIKSSILKKQSESQIVFSIVKVTCSQSLFSEIYEKVPIVYFLRIIFSNFCQFSLDGVFNFKIYFVIVFSIMFLEVF